MVITFLTIGVVLYLVVREKVSPAAPLVRLAYDISPLIVHGWLIVTVSV